MKILLMSTCRDMSCKSKMLWKITHKHGNCTRLEYKSGYNRPESVWVYSQTNNDAINLTIISIPSFKKLTPSYENRDRIPTSVPVSFRNEKTFHCFQRHWNATWGENLKKMPTDGASTTLGVYLSILKAC